MMSVRWMAVGMLGLLVTGVPSDVARAVSQPTAAVGPNPAPAPVDIDNNPYVELYKLRVAEAESNLHRQQALADLAAANLERARKLISTSAMAAQEYETIVSEAAVTRADVDLASKKVDESKAYLKIITALVKRGVTIPLCTYEME